MQNNQNNLFKTKTLVYNKMILFHFDKLSDSDDKKEIVWNNIELADEHLNLDLIIASCLSWLSLHKDKDCNLSDLEKQLRIHQLNTHLYAKPLETGGYECIFLCSPKEEAIQELLSYKVSYEDNLIHLKDAKFRSNIGIFWRCEEVLETYTKEDQQNILDVKNLKTKIRIEKQSENELLRQIREEIKKKYGQEPIPLIFRKTEEGDDMYLFTVNDKVVSDIGYIMRQTETSIEYEIIKLSL